ncbi:hypothetical protein AZ20_4184 [Bordetella bronchiseptica E014]|uniref:N-acetyltransferase YedL n=1 Tax=Bordetella bronchiseptica 00-P-2796 TaxID=1331199 RepID=A0ABR4RAV5_BORBO|nr:hypothetical protein L576_4387 [Bordetella bronchiseptica OSU054]KAK72090.1 hypothetical protein L507_4080 [Bordetella bronchiseptica CA90 BB02]KAK73121.1 hypothetical protein L530_4178 [Bordetella bronchiseptica MO211]KCV25204.1 hypothetical protein L489_4530 [Bordetella bronchiseptica 00-P-2730]KCV32633.1 hypothetical protein L490_3957 [Bordetella bronchiseptica 00-P-2796]KCV43510.1 hypothetical protein L572_4266 [Bordetella bronchiseptica 345]KCV56402.1 hypothetical protein L492_4167 [B
MKMLPASFRRRFLKEIEGLFVQVLLIIEIKSKTQYNS